MVHGRFRLSLRNVEDMLAEREIGIFHEAVRHWWNRFGPLFAMTCLGLVLAFGSPEMLVPKVLPAAVVVDRQDSQPAGSAEGVGQKVHRPAIVRAERHSGGQVTTHSAYNILMATFGR